jgi:hypothetical protein
MSRIHLAGGIAAGLLLLSTTVVTSFASVVPNLAAVASPDQYVAVTYAGPPNNTQSVLEAGAFTTQMQSFGMIGIPNYDPTTEPGSTLVCEMPLASGNGIWVVYGINNGVGVQEATEFCYKLQQVAPIRWR